jgi:hypothetical protein
MLHLLSSRNGNAANSVLAAHHKLLVNENSRMNDQTGLSNQVAPGMRCKESVY